MGGDGDVRVQKRRRIAQLDGYAADVKLCKRERVPGGVVGVSGGGWLVLGSEGTWG